MSLSNYLSKRSELSAVACWFLWDLSKSEARYVPWAMCGIAVLAVAYMILDHFKRRPAQ